MIVVYFVAIILCLFQIADINDHNKKVDKMWPDNSSQHDGEMRLRMRMTPFALYLLIVILAFYIIHDIISLFR